MSRLPIRSIDFGWAFFGARVNQKPSSPELVLPSEPDKVAPLAAIRRVERELIQRENQIMSDMLGISGLIV